MGAEDIGLILRRYGSRLSDTELVITEPWELNVPVGIISSKFAGIDYNSNRILEKIKEEAISHLQVNYMNISEGLIVRISKFIINRYLNEGELVFVPAPAVPQKQVDWD